MYCLLFTFCFFMSVNTHKQTQEGSNQESMLSGNSMIKLENAGLRAPRKMSLGSGLHSQKRIRAPVSKMVGLRAPKQKFQGSRAPGTPPLGPWILARFLHRWSIVGIWVLFWFILWLQYLRFSEARFGSPLVELFKVLFWFISARVWLKIMAQFTFWLER